MAFHVLPLSSLGVTPWRKCMARSSQLMPQTCGRGGPSVGRGLEFRSEPGVQPQLPSPSLGGLADAELGSEGCPCLSAPWGLPGTRRAEGGESCWQPRGSLSPRSAQAHLVIEPHVDHGHLADHLDPAGTARVVGVDTSSEPDLGQGTPREGRCYGLFLGIWEE